MDDAGRFDLAVRQIVGKRLTWNRPNRQRGLGFIRSNVTGPRQGRGVRRRDQEQLAHCQ